MQTKTKHDIEATCSLCDKTLLAKYADLDIERRSHWTGAKGLWQPVLICDTCDVTIDIVGVPDDKIQVLINNRRRDAIKREIQV